MTVDLHILLSFVLLLFVYLFAIFFAPIGLRQPLLYSGAALIVIASGFIVLGLS